MMRKHYSVLLFALLVMVVMCWSALATETGAQNLSATGLSQMPVQFITNNGQAPDDVRFMVNSMSYSFDFTNTSMIVAGLSENSSTGGNASVGSPLIVTLKGANNKTMVTGEDQLPGYANFIKGKNQSEWKTQVPWYGTILYSGILPGINLSYSGKTGKIKREYTVSPGADPSAIRLIYSGGSNMSLTSDGSIRVMTGFGNLTEAAPVSYQEINGSKIPVNSSYAIISDTEVGYQIGTYDPAYPLVIDPTLIYSTYLGGTLEDYGMGIAVDSTGDAYVAGYTSSCDFPILNPINMLSPVVYSGALCHNSIDAYVTKIHQEGDGNASIIFSTYIGGTKSDIARGIVLDEANNIYITGDTESDDYPIMNPLQNGAYLKGSSDVFVTKVRYDGASLDYSTFIGGTGTDIGNGIAIDSLRNVYITGQTSGNSPLKAAVENYPTTTGAYQTEPNPDATMGDAFVSKIGPFGNTLVYSSYISGANQDAGNGIAVDNQGRAYIVGTTSSSNLLPSGVPRYQNTLNGVQDAFLFRMNMAASPQVEYATYLGGSSGYDYGQSVAVDTAYCAYVTGATSSQNFPVTSLAYQNHKGWPLDAFEKDAYVTKFSPDGTGLVYSTYLGGTKDDWGYGIVVDSDKKVYVTGYSMSTDFPVLDTIKQGQPGMNQEGFLTCINPSGSSLNYSTLFGGQSDEVARAVALGPDNSAYLTGWTASPSMSMCTSGVNCENLAFPTLKYINQAVKKNGADATYDGGALTGGYEASCDAFVMKFGTQSLSAVMTSNLTSSCGLAPLVVQFYDNTTSSNVIQRVWNFGDNSAPVVYGSTAGHPVHTYASVGTYTASLTVYGYTSQSTATTTMYVCGSSIHDNFTIAGHNMTEAPIAVPVGSSQKFNGTADFTPFIWDWNFGDGTANETGKLKQSVYHTFTSQGVFNVILTASTGGCCDNASTMRQIRSYYPPMARFENTSQRTGICAPATVQFMDISYNSSNIGAPTAWNWNFGDNTPNSTLQNPSHIYNYAGEYTVTLTATNPAGSNTYQMKNYVVVGGTAYAGFTGTPVTGKTPLTVQFTDHSTTSVGAVWDFGDGSPLNTTRNPVHTYTGLGSYDVGLTAIGLCADNYTEYKNYITVNGNISPTIQMGTSMNTLASNPVNSSTKPLIVYMQGNTTDGSLIDEAWWDYGNGTGTVHQERAYNWPDNNTWFNTSYVYDKYGDFTPVLRVSNHTWPTDPIPSTGSMYLDYIGVYQKLLAGFTFSPTTAVTGQDIQFTDTSTGSPVTWNWTFGNPQEGSSLLKNPAYAFPTSGTKWVLLNVTNKYGDRNSTSQTIPISLANTTGIIRFEPQNIQMIPGQQNYRKVNVILDKADTGLTSFSMRMNVTDENIASFNHSASPPDWASAYGLQFISEPVVGTGGHYKGMNMSGYMASGHLPVGMTNISLGYVYLFGSTPGTASIDIVSPSSIVQWNSSFMTLLSVPGSIIVNETSVIPGQTNLPQDTNHDGLIDDFNGDGVINTYDVNVFFAAYNAGTLSALPVSTIDYNHNGVLDMADIVIYFNTVILA